MGESISAVRDTIGQGAVRRAIVRHLLTAFRLLVTGGLLWLLASRIDIARASDLVFRCSMPLLVAAAAALAATTPLITLRWRAFLALGGAVPSTIMLWKIVLVGWFFNQALPTGVGGDAVRAWRCHRFGISLGVAIRSVLLDRASGYFVLVVLYAAGLSTLLREVHDPLLQQAIIVVFSASVMGLAALFTLDLMPSFLAQLPLLTPVAALSKEARRFCAIPRRLAANLALSACGMALTILSFKLIGDGIGARLSYATWIVVVPPVALIQLVPVSLAGWGVREVALIPILGVFGIPGETALATSLACGLCQIMVALLGGLVWLARWDAAHSAAGGRCLASSVSAQSKP